MKSLTEKQAKNCEEAREPVCRCRCGGMLHGKSRGGGDAGRLFYENLPTDDPHYVEGDDIKAARRQEKIEAERREHEEQQRRLWEYRAQCAREQYEIEREYGPL